LGINNTSPRSIGWVLSLLLSSNFYLPYHLLPPFFLNPSVAALFQPSPSIPKSKLGRLLQRQD
jgi:hypothetical protein